MNPFTYGPALFVCLFLISVLHPVLVYAKGELALHAMLSKKSYAEGPTSGQFKYKLNKNAVLINKQPIMGFSAMLVTDKQHVYWFLTDNGFGKKNISADFIPRLYEVHISTEGKVTYTKRYLEFTDKNNKLSFPIQANYVHYYDNPENPKVDSDIIKNKTLTGADIDPESIQIDANNRIWIGDGYGPFLIETDSRGNVIHQEYEIPGIQSKDHPLEITQSANIDTSGGIEAMAITPDKQTLHLILQKRVQGDAYSVLRLYTFNIPTKSFNASYLNYPVDPGTTVTDMVAIDQQHFYVLERAKKPAANLIYQINLTNIQKGVLQKQIVANLNDLIPSKLTLESIGILDDQKVMLVNDNDGGKGTFFQVIEIDTLNPESVNHAINHEAIEFKLQKKTLDLVKFKFKQGYFHDDDKVSWFITTLYFMTLIIFFRVFLLARHYAVDSSFWLILTIFILVMGLNKQFDIQTDIKNYIRDIAIYEGWYESRAYIKKLLILSITLIGMLTFVKAKFILKRYWIRYKWICLCFGLLIFYILMRLISLHAMDITLRYQIYEIIKVQQIIEISIIMLLMISCIPFTKGYLKTQTNLNHHK